MEEPNERTARKRDEVLEMLEKLKLDACTPVKNLQKEVEAFYMELLQRGKSVEENIESVNELQDNLENHLNTLLNSFEEADIKIHQLDDTDGQWIIVRELQTKNAEIKNMTTSLRKNARQLKMAYSQKEQVQNQILEKLTFLKDATIRMTGDFMNEIKRALDTFSGDVAVRSSLVQLERKLNDRIFNVGYCYETIRQKIEASGDNNEGYLKMFQTEKNHTAEFIAALEEELQRVVQQESPVRQIQTIKNEDHAQRSAATGGQEVSPQPTFAESIGKRCKINEKLRNLYDATRQSLNDLQRKIDLSTRNADNHDQKQKLSEMEKTVSVHVENLDAAYELASLKTAREEDNNSKIDIFILFQRKQEAIKKEISEISTNVKHLKDNHMQRLIDKEKQIDQLKQIYEKCILQAHNLKDTIGNIITDNDDTAFIDKEDMIKDLKEVSNNLQNITKAYDATYKEERERLDKVDDVAKQCEILVNFKHTSERIQTDIVALNAKFTAIKERYDISPEALLARAMRSQAIDMGLELKSINNLKIYKLPLQERHTNSTLKLRRYELGEIRIDKVHRHILLTGMTGSGKSLLINNMINYVYGVSRKDKFRFKLIVDEEEIIERGEGASKSMAKSMTSWVTCFTFNWQEGFRIDYSLTVIDTPGFGDTRGLKYDKMIVDQIKYFFNCEQLCPTQELTSIGLLIKASEVRITDEQKYIFNQILNMFGKDMKNNIFINFTFADTEEPKALEVVISDNIPYAAGCLFKFNNSALYASNHGEHSLVEWKFGYANLSHYFEKLLQLQHMSLKLTKKVLDEQEQLTTALGALQSEIEQGMETLRLIECQSNVIVNLQGAINANKNHTVKKEIYKSHLEIVDHHITNCKKCDFTCHSPCKIAGDMKKSCYAMKNGFCTVCAGKCPYTMHINGNKIYVYTPVIINETLEDMAKDYQVNVDDKDAKKKLLSGMLEKYKKQKHQVLEYIKQANECSNRLDEISLRPSYLSDVAYIDRLIHSAEQSSRPYKTERLGQYRALKEMAETLKDAKENPASLTDRVSKYEQNIADIIKTIGEEFLDLSFGGVSQLEGNVSTEFSSGMAESVAPDL